MALSCVVLLICAATTAKSLGPCSAQQTFASCMAASAEAEQNNKLEHKCSWCMKKGPHGVVARCESCGYVKSSEVEGLMCLPNADTCAKRSVAIFSFKSGSQ